MMWLALLVAVLLWWLMTGLALMSVHQSLRNQRIIFALATVFVLWALVSVESNAR